MPLPENHCSTLFTTGYKRLTEGGCKAFAFWVRGGFWLLDERRLFDMGVFWKGKTLLKENS
jgi:hypothetical protein